jgi:hypothetical protein
MPAPEYIDSQEVNDTEVLWRVVPPEHLKLDLASMTFRVSEGAFRTEELSVYRSSKRSLPDVLALWPQGSKVRAFTAEFARHENKCIVILDPEDSSHVMIRRQDLPTKRLTGSQANAFIRNSEFVEP